MKARIPISFLGILVIGCAASGGGAPPPAKKTAPRTSSQKAVTKARREVVQAPKIRTKPSAKVTKGSQGGKAPGATPPKNKKPQGSFENNAFPPTLSDLSYHRTGWKKNDCLRCHETGVGKAPEVHHKGMPRRLLTAKCRSCHVLIPGSKAKVIEKKSSRFLENAFPPMVPASPSHKNVWRNNDCLLCHDSGIRGAPVVKHKGMPRILLKSKCRSCHVQVRVLDVKKKGH
ncbi:MAG TPA: hypothetical protein ENK02_04055 [Planctomycetes bacterium]|nr:hypothetical protein [Planctomycetota bacterium]